MLRFPDLGAHPVALSLVALMPGEGGSVAWRLLLMSKWEVRRGVK